MFAQRFQTQQKTSLNKHSPINYWQEQEFGRDASCRNPEIVVSLNKYALGNNG